MTEQDIAIKHNALAGRSEDLVPLIEQAADNLDSETAIHLETAWLKHGSHELFQKMKGVTSALHDDLPELVGDNSIGTLDKYEESIAECLRAFRKETADLVGVGLTPEEAREQSLARLLDVVKDWHNQGTPNAPIKGQLAALADKPWSNDHLREVIVEDWAGGIKQGLWTVATVTSQEARQRIDSGIALADVVAWYKPAAEELFDEVIASVDLAISETQPHPVQNERPAQ